MALKFKGKPIPGLHGPIIRPSPEIPLRRVKFWHLRGEGEVVGRITGRALLVNHLLFNRCDTPSKLVQELEKLDNLVGANGTLEETGNFPQTFGDCTFDGYDPILLEGQQEPGPLKDIGETLPVPGSHTAADKGWFIYLQLRFRQLRVAT